MDDINIPTLSVNDETLDPYSLENSNNLADRLRSSSIECADYYQTFLPFLTLSRILNKACIEAHLKKEYGDLASQYADQIGPLYADEADAYKEMPFKMPSGQKTYLRIFAILVMIEKEGKVHEFIQHRVCDDDLPLTLDIRQNAVFRKEGDENPLGCFRRFRPYQLESFEMCQWRFTAPFFHAPRDNIPVFHHVFHRRTILPWCRLNGSEVGLKKFGRHITQGGYSTIQPIKIDKSSHEFEKVLRGVVSWSAF